MPYILRADRDLLKGDLERLLTLMQQYDEKDWPGVLNYVVTTLTLGLVEPRYRYIAMVTGVLENVKQEFYRRYAAAYEDGKMEQNGDVYHS